jgi:hypothetical protein
MAADDLAPNLADPLATAATSAALSPWSENSSDADGRVGRTSANSRDQPAGDRRHDQRGGSFPVYLAGVGGTIVAGALFPIAMLLVFAVADSDIPPLKDFVLILAMGLLMGGLFAGGAAIWIFPIVALVQYLAGLSRSRAVMASIAGGWSGVAATQWLFGERALGDTSLMSQLLTLVALVMGQVGAGWFARTVRRSQTQGWPEGDPEAPARFTLRQLLGLTAGVAVIAAIVSALRLSPEAHQAILWSLLLQGAMICLYFAIAKSRRFT